MPSGAEIHPSLERQYIAPAQWLSCGRTGGLAASQQTFEAESCMRGSAARVGIMKDNAACLEVKKWFRKEVLAPYRPCGGCACDK